MSDLHARIQELEAENARLREEWAQEGIGWLRDKDIDRLMGVEDENKRLRERVSDLMRELAQVRATNARLDATLGNLDAENARLHEIIEDKTASLRVEIAAKQGAHNLIRIMEMALRRAVRALDEEQAIQPESQIHHELKDALS